MELPTINAADGVAYTARRLGYDDIFELGQIAAHLVSRGSAELGPRVRLAQGMAQLEALALSAAFGLPGARDSIREWTSSVFSLPEGALADPNQFPAGTLPGVFGALFRHPDLVEAVRVLTEGDFLEQISAHLAERFGA